MAAQERLAFCYFSLKIKNLDGPKHVIKCDLDKNIGDIINDKLGQPVTDIYVGNSSIFSDKTTTSISGDTPVHVIVDLQIGKHIIVSVKPDDEKNETKDNPNAFDVLMRIGRKNDHLPQPRKIVHNKDKLFNAVREILKSRDIGFPQQNADLANKVLSDLTNVLWYLDPHHEKFKERRCHFPEIFRSLQGFTDYKAAKKKKPVLHACILQTHCEAIGNILLMPWIRNPKFRSFYEELSQFFEALTKYQNKMEEHNEKSRENHASLEPVRSLKDNWSTQPVVVGDRLSSHSAMTAVLDSKGNYEAVQMDPYLPEDRKKTKGFIQNLTFPYKVTLMTYCFGNQLGNTYFLWKTDEYRSDEEVSVINTILESIPTFSTRAMRRDFLDKYAKISEPKYLREIWRDLTNDSAAAETAVEGELDMRVINFFLSADDTDLIIDLRKHNGRTADPRYDVFWAKLESILEEKSVVHERRKDNIGYFPDWISLRDLREDVLRQCPEGTEAPSESWIRHNFQPCNPYLNTSTHYTGRFNVKYSVQQRILRAEHPDAKFCALLWRYLKDFVFKWREDCHLITVDDKAIIPVGEPHKPLSATARRHGRSITVTSASLLAMDHDYHTAGIVPSVVLHIVIPEDKDDSFHSGKLSVTVKDKYFQPSSSMRHCAETAKLLQRETAIASGGDVDTHTVCGDFAVPILAVYSDGGPDHNVSFMSVKLAAIAVFVNLDLDFYIAVRCAPCQSYMNPAERCMATLNIPLQGVSLSRSEMSEHFEGLAKRQTSLKAIRAAATRNEHFKEALKESMEQPIDILVNRFGRMTHSGNIVEAFKGVDDKWVSETADILQIFVDDNSEELDLVRITKNPHLYPKLKNFMEEHCRSRQYSFQIRKCLSDECWYCSLLHPPRLPVDQLQALHWLPDPTKSQDGAWHSFSDNYGTVTTDVQRPSMMNKPTSASDIENKTLFVTGKVRGFVICAECGKRRCVYSARQLTNQQKLAVERVEDDLIFTCGDALFPEGDLVKTVVVRQAITCHTPIEVNYYSGLPAAAQICYVCGDSEVLDQQHHSGLHDLHQEFGIVRPICKTCWETGRRPATRNPVQTNKRKK